MMDVASELGFDSVFCGAKREEGLPELDSWGGRAVERIGVHFPMLNGKRPLTYIHSVLCYNAALFSRLRQIRPTLVHASDIETMPAAFLYRLISRAGLLYNIHDNVSQRYNAPAWVRAILNMFEGMAVLCANRVLVPEPFRREALPFWCRHKVLVVRNTPKDRGATPAPDLQDGRIRIFYGGWLDWTRGLDELLRLITENEDFEMCVAGEGSPEVLERICSTPRVTFLGYLLHEEAVDAARTCHIVPALYDPKRQINRYAASNKLAESLSAGRPLLLNEEMLIARDLEDYQCTVTLPYSDAANAGPRLRALIKDDPEGYGQMCLNARRAYEELYSWEKAKQGMVAAINEVTVDRK